MQDKGEYEAIGLSASPAFAVISVHLRPIRIKSPKALLDADFPDER